MANQEHVKAIKEGVEFWNNWRDQSPEEVPDLAWANLVGIDLAGANFDLFFALDNFVLQYQISLD